MSSQSPIPWFDDFVGVAYRYYDLRMNVVPLITDRKQSASLWHDSIHWWVDPSIKIRFVEMENDYWFIMGSDSQKPDTNLAFFKILPKSEHYERFKAGHGGEAYLRLGVYIKKSLSDAKKVIYVLVVMRLKIMMKVMMMFVCSMIVVVDYFPVFKLIF
jgi:hypothetical protein